VKIPAHQATIPRGKYLGRDADLVIENDADHFIRCPACHGWIDCRDLSSVFDHEGPLPHPAWDQAQ